MAAPEEEMRPAWAERIEAGMIGGHGVGMIGGHGVGRVGELFRKGRWEWGRWNWEGGKAEISKLVVSNKEMKE